MGSALCKRHLERPAHDDPLQELRRRSLELGTEERFQAQVALRGRHQHVAARYRGQPGGIPPGRAREAPELLALATGPRDFHGLPGRIAALGPALQAPWALALDGFGPPFAFGLRSGGGIQRRIPAQARDHGHLTFATGQRQRYGRAAAIDDQDPPSPWQPATPWLHHLPPPIHAGFRPPWAALGLGPAAGGQTGPRPHSSAPGTW